MMKKVFAAAMAVTLSVLFTACSSVTTGTNLHDMKLSESNELQTIAHLNGDVWGIYLFGILPLFTGSTATPGSCAVFKDTVRLDNAVSMLSRKAAALEATRVTDLSSATSSTWLFLISMKSVQVSGNALK